MEDINNPSQSMGFGQPHQHQVNHTRPFFYVQPPSQPYFMYQWPMNPYGQYGYPGQAALPYGRPYVPSYQYMQYPGYVVPQAPMQPVDYRRIINPRLPSAATYDFRFRHHFQQTSVQRETACSEAQTEPSDPVNKLINSLDRLKTREQPVDDRELNSGVVVSSTPGVMLRSQEREKLNGLDGELEFEPLSRRLPHTKGELGDVVLPSTLSDSAVFDVESSQGRLEECVLSDVLPLDSSSVHEECLTDRGDDFDQNEKSLTDDQFRDEARNHPDPHTGHECGALTRVPDCNGAHNLSDCQSSEQGGDHVNMLHPSAEVFDSPTKPVSDVENLPYRILRLPCNKATVTGLLHKDNDPVLYLDPATDLVPPQSYLSSFGSAYYYSYYPQVAQERQSVLSPSIDELSSRDEMFSTDVEDMDLISGHVYMGSGRLAEATGDALVHAGEEDVENGAFVKDCAVCQTCATCGLRLPEEGKRSKGLGYCSNPKEDVSDEVLGQDDCDLDIEEGGEVLSDCESQRVPVKKPQHHNGHPLPPCGLQLSKCKARKGCCEDQEGMVDPEEEDQDYQGYKPMAKADKHKGRGQRSAQSRPYTEKQRRAGTEASDQESWASCGSKPRPRFWKHVTGPQEQVRPARRRASCKTFVQQRPRRNEYDDHDEAEFSHCQRGRGSMKRRGTRY